MLPLLKPNPPPSLPSSVVRRVSYPQNIGCFNELLNEGFISSEVNLFNKATEHEESSPQEDTLEIGISAH